MKIIRPTALVISRPPLLMISGLLFLLHSIPAVNGANANGEANTITLDTGTYKHQTGFL